MADCDLLATIRRRALQALVPPERLPLSTWISREIRLPDTSAAPGPMSLWPYQVGIADALGEPNLERISIVKAARVGMTSLFTAAIANFCANDPAPILCVLPTESDCRDYVGSDLEPTFAASPAVAGVLSQELIGQRGRRGRNTMLSRQFPGGSLRIVASHAPRNLRAKTARILFVDEADAMLETGGEGSPIALAEKRTLSFSDRKIIVGSTPIDEETSHVLRLWERSDQRIFEVPCPACGAFAEIMWANIEWPPGEPEGAAYRCPHCQGLIGPEAKPAMVSAGRWRATRPEIVGHAGFRLNALVSLLHNARWGILAAEFLAAKDDPELLKPFVNCTLGQGWRSQGDDLDEGSLLGRVEDFGLSKIPAEVLVITVGVDIQDSRIEASYTGWARDGTCFILDHSVFWGPTTDETVWQDLSDALLQRWAHPLGGVIGVDAAAIDAGDGGVFDRVLKFCAGRAARRTWAIKGISGFSRSAFAPSGKLKNRPGQSLFLVGVDAVKSLLFQRLKRGDSIRFSNTLEPDWFDQLCSERLITRFSRGRPERRFERIPGKRAEALDCVVYSYAARQGLALNLDAREAALRLQPQSSAPPRVTRSRWLEGL